MAADVNHHSQLPLLLLHTPPSFFVFPCLQLRWVQQWSMLSTALATGLVWLKAWRIHGRSLPAMFACNAAHKHFADHYCPHQASAASSRAVSDGISVSSVPASFSTLVPICTCAVTWQFIFKLDCKYPGWISCTGSACLQTINHLYLYQLLTVQFFTVQYLICWHACVIISE